MCSYKMDVNIDISLVDDLEELSLERTLKVQKVLLCITFWLINRCLFDTEITNTFPFSRQVFVSDYMSVDHYVSFFCIV